MRGSCCRPCAATGGLRTLSTGSWTWPSGKDGSRVRTSHAAHNLSILRRMALNLLRQETTAKGGIAARRKQASWNDGYLLKVLSH